MNWKQQIKWLREQQEKEQAWSATQAEKQMQFQHQESSTAHQREVADLQAAGLNPVLSTNGAGASTGSGAMGDASSIVPELMDVLKSAVQVHKGGTNIKIDNGNKEIETPSSYFTKQHFKQGLNAGQGAYHGSARGLKGAKESLQRNVDDAKKELAKSFTGVSFSAGIRGTFNGMMLPNGSARFTGEDVEKITNAFDKFQRAKGEYNKLGYYENARATQDLIESLKEGISNILNKAKIPFEYRKKLSKYLWM